jgi:hypothetical protein
MIHLGLNQNKNWKNMSQKQKSKSLLDRLSTKTGKLVVASVLGILVLAGSIFAGQQFTKNKDVAKAAEPLGYLESYNEAGTLYGWAADADSPNQAIEVHIYMDGAPGVGTFIGRTITNIDRPDATAYTGIPGLHGFNFQVPSKYYINNQTHTYYAYGINVGAGSNQQLGNSIQMQILNPFGIIDNVAPGSGKVQGWAFDPSDPNANIQVHLYYDAPAGQGGDGPYVTTANLPRPDVNLFYSGSNTYGLAGNTYPPDTYSLPGDHGWASQIPAKFLDGAAHKVYAYAINIGPGQNQLISSVPSPYVFTLADPLGVVDSISPNTAVVNGWAFDRNVTAQSIDVHLYVDGEIIGVTNANIARQDVNDYYGITGNHGYTYRIPAKFLDGNIHTLTAYAIDAQDPNKNSNIGSQKFQIKDPIGYLDDVSSAGLATGWAADRNAPNLGIQVDFYIDGQAGTGGVLVGSAIANNPRQDVNDFLQITGNHGFNFQIPNQYLDNQVHTLHAYAISPNGAQLNSYLGYKQFRATPDATTIGAGNIGNGTCAPNPTTIGTRITCTYPLTGDPNGKYQVPTEGLYGVVFSGNADENAGNGDRCVVSGTNLVCNNIPTAGLPAGARDAGIHQPTVAWMHNKSSVTLQDSLVIGAGNIGTGNCGDTSAVVIGSTITCTFPLTGSTNNQYSLPTGGLKGLVYQGTSPSDTNNGGLSRDCQVVGTNLICSEIPTTGRTAGAAKIGLKGTAGYIADKGTATLVAPSIGQPVATTANPITGQIGTIMPNIALTGSTANNLPVTFTPAGCTTGIAGTVSNNTWVPTNGALIPTCATTGAQTGVLSATGVTSVNVPTAFTNPAPTSTGDVLLIDQTKIVFNPPKDQAKEFCGSQGAANTRCADLKVAVQGDTRIQDGATCVFEVRPYPSSGNANPAYSGTPLTNGGQATYTAGKCEVTLPKAAQNVPKWEFRIRVTNPSTGTNAGKVYGADPAYFMLYGAIGVVNISGVAL